MSLGSGGPPCSLQPVLPTPSPTLVQPFTCCLVRKMVSHYLLIIKRSRARLVGSAVQDHSRNISTYCYPIVRHLMRKQKTQVLQVKWHNSGEEPTHTQPSKPYIAPNPFCMWMSFPLPTVFVVNISKSKRIRSSKKKPPQMVWDAREITMNPQNHYSPVKSK